MSVIIPVRNEGGRVARAVRSITAGRSRRFPLELVIVDDASTDGGCDRLAELADPAADVTVVVRRLGRWSGIPFARNRGAEVATHPVYVVTDGNTRFGFGWDVAIRHAFRPGRILAGTIHDLGSDFRGYGCALELPSMGVAWLPVPNAYGGPVPVAACTCTVVGRDLFHHLGGYDESLPLYGAAEPEFSVRAWLSGYEVVNVPDLQIHHRFRPRGEYAAFRRSIEHVLTLNYLRFACAYLPEERLWRTYDHYAARLGDRFDACMAEVVAGGVWDRRAELGRTLPLDFGWFARRFDLDRPAAGGGRV